MPPLTRLTQAKTAVNTLPVVVFADFGFWRVMQVALPATKTTLNRNAVKKSFGVHCAYHSMSCSSHQHELSCTSHGMYCGFSRNLPWNVPYFPRDSMGLPMGCSIFHGASHEVPWEVKSRVKGPMGCIVVTVRFSIGMYYSLSWEFHGISRGKQRIPCIGFSMGCPTAIPGRGPLGLHRASHGNSVWMHRHTHRTSRGTSRASHRIHRAAHRAPKGLPIGHFMGLVTFRGTSHLSPPMARPTEGP